MRGMALSVGAVALSSLLVGCAPPRQGVRGDYPGPTPQWTEYGGEYCAYCGGGPSLSLWAKGRSTAGPTSFYLETRMCADGAETDLYDGRASLFYGANERARVEHRATSGTLQIHRCDGAEAHPYADVTFWVTFEDGHELSGRIATPLRYDHGWE